MVNDNFVALRAVEPSDVEVLYQWENDIALWQVSNTLVPFSRYQLMKYIEAASLDIYQTRQLRLMIDIIEKPGNKEPVGILDFFDFDPFHNRGGIGILIHEKWQNKGVASAAIKLFCNYAFRHLRVHQLYCNISVSNAASIKLFENCGFLKVGVKKQWIKTKDDFVDEIMYQLINPEHH